MPDKPFSAEPIVIVRIEQPFCSLSFGNAPCTATGTPCFNTYSTCGDQQNHTPGPTLDLYFGIPGQGKPSDEIMILPFLAGWPSTSSPRVNVSGADRRLNPLGLRATASIPFRDAPHTDFLVDPYLSTRSYDPIARGTFWSKWLTRNVFGKSGMTVSIFEGFAGQALADMVKRVYISDAVDFSGAETVLMKCRDILSKATDEKALMPPVSPGFLLADLDNNPATLTFKIAGAVLADYPASGTLRINDEILTYSALAEDVNGFIDVTVTSRATDGSEIGSHEAEDSVQEVYRFDGVSVDVGLAAAYSYTTIPSARLPVADWATEASLYLSAYVLDGLIPEPTAVEEVVGEILEQAQAFQWWDEVAEEVRFRAVKPLTERPKRLTEDTGLIAGTVKIREFPERRVSRVYVFFDPRDPTSNEERNFRRVQGSLDLALEDAKAYGDKAIRKIIARFINSTAVALETTSRILARYKRGSREISFAVSDKDEDIEIGDVIEVVYHRDQDTTGAAKTSLWIVTSRDPKPAERRVYFVAEDATLAGQLLAISENSVGDYVGDGSDPFGVGWISDASGLLPNGDPGFTIQ
ncbi:MAG: hypothetical protein AAF982_01980 [Pseudomonadota bacterium]